MENSSWDSLIQFTNKHWPIKNKTLSRATQLQKDLGIKGDDADIFIYKFAETFNVNIENLKLANYFDGYDDSLLKTITGIFIPNRLKKRSEKKMLTLGDLEKAIIHGILI